MNLIFSFLFIIVSSCNKKIIAQSFKGFVTESYSESTWIPGKSEESYLYKVNDTTRNKINLIFEISFDDSVHIDINSKNIYKKRILTERNLSVVNQEFNIEFINYVNPVIQISLIEKKKTILFHPKLGYLLCYVSRINDVWSLEYSNYQRVYY